MHVSEMHVVHACMCTGARMGTWRIVVMHASVCGCDMCMHASHAWYACAGERCMYAWVLMCMYMGMDVWMMYVHVHRRGDACMYMPPMYDVYAWFACMHAMRYGNARGFSANFFFLFYISVLF
jgi:hypothetical protein